MLLREEPGPGGEFAITWCGFGSQMGVEGECWSLSMCTMGVDDGLSFGNEGELRVGCQ